ncbi:ABC transporter substrate-binding protein [Bradyrhizobium macuxiense]|uniref:ABC transporter substrate-binding protein n=1 Tax=Bradyrhizobium macuxiense TaxID=1755647 RepID=A0A109JM56_9BRAD|nr:ABC transporter substrate-binding protein [Bradyrhizobium macuxiense]KWV51370.1 ABC transporter substrate-binding protein [Bradyrhizobium macuxiense]
MRRRDFILLGSALVWPLAAQASPERPTLVAWLSGGTTQIAQPFVASFLDGMREFGYVEGRDFDMAYRSAEGVLDRLPALAEEIVRLKPDVILAAAVSSAVPARKATSAIPIVCPALADAVHLGLVASEARPGGNVTGIEPYVAGLPAKQMELVREVAPGAQRVGLLTNLRDPKAPPQAQELEATAKVLEMTIATADVNRSEEIDGAMQALASQYVDVVIVLQTTLLLSLSRRIAELAVAKRLPTIYGYREHVAAGGLISYGVDLRWCYRRSAYFVVKILHGTPPGDLPVEFPSKMLLSVNLKTAKALAVKIPEVFLLRADEVIE